MIVITIIGILSSIGILTYQNLIKNSRDAKRLSDIKTLQSALEEYRADKFHYPPTFDLKTTPSLTNGTGINPAPAITKTYLRNIPQDPLSGTPAGYEYRGLGTGCDSTVGGALNCESYCIYAKMENPANILTDPNCTLNPTAEYNTAVSIP